MLCQLTEIKTRLGITTSGDDTVLTAFANAVESRFNQYCGRVFARSATAEMMFDAEAMQVSVDRYPVESVTAFYLRTKATEAWSAVSVDYEILDGGVLALQSMLGCTGQRAKVVYIGGYVLPGTTPGTGQTALPYDVQAAALDQAALWYEQRHSLRTIQPGAKGALSPATSALALLPHVVEILDRYRRLIT